MVEDVESPHTTSFYMDETRKPSESVVPDEDKPNWTGTPGYTSSDRPFFEELTLARDIIERHVQSELTKRTKHILELQPSDWKANIVGFF
jgi:hypothetical protein